MHHLLRETTDLALDELWKTIGAVAVAIVAYLGTRRSNKPPKEIEPKNDEIKSPPKEERISFPTPPGVPEVSIDLQALPKDLADVIKLLATVTSDMQAQLSVQARKIGELRNQERDHILIKAAFGVVVDWMDKGAQPPAPVIRREIRTILFGDDYAYYNTPSSQKTKLD